MFAGTTDEYREAKRKVVALLDGMAHQLNHLDDIHPGLADMAHGQIVTGLGSLKRRGPRWVVND